MYTIALDISLGRRLIQTVRTVKKSFTDSRLEWLVSTRSAVCVSGCVGGCVGGGTTSAEASLCATSQTDCHRGTKITKTKCHSQHQNLYQD